MIKNPLLTEKHLRFMEWLVSDHDEHNPRDEKPSGEWWAQLFYEALNDHDFEDKE